MQAYLSFLQVFFSKQFTQFLDIEDIPDYRGICKKTRYLRLEIYLSSSEYTFKQIHKKIPLDATEYYEIVPNTIFKRVEHEMNRYYDMFDHIRVEDRIGCDIYLELYDTEKDITDDEKTELYSLGKRHYIYTHFRNDNCHRHIFAFSSQQELLHFILQITDLIYRNRFYHCESCIFDEFIKIQQSTYPDIIYKYITEDECSRCIEISNELEKMRKK